MGRPSSSELSAVRQLIAQLPPDSKRHVEAVAAALREIVADDDDTPEVELASRWCSLSWLREQSPKVSPLTDPQRDVNRAQAKRG